MTANHDHSSQAADCERGAQFAGASRPERFAAAEQDLVHHHPQLRGAPELDGAWPMAEARSGADNA